MKVKKITVGFIQENCYIVYEEATKNAVVIDPGADGEEIVEALEGLNPVAIVATHGHIDHVGQVGYLKQKYNIPFCLSGKDKFLTNNELFPSFATAIDAKPCPEPDIDLDKLEKLSVGGINFELIRTPGHTPGSVCLYNRENKLVIVGDTLFNGGVGRTDLPGGSSSELENSLKRLMQLPDDTVVYSGHGPNTTVGKEKITNPFITGRFRLR